MKAVGDCWRSLLCASATQAFAQAFPAKSVKMIVPYPPGGGNDTLGRLFAAKLSERTGQQFVVENRPGAGAMIGTEAAARSAADGYTILLSSIATHALSPNLYSKVPYDPVKDFAPVTLLGIAPTVLVVTNDLPAKDLSELVAAAKAKPGTSPTRPAATGRRRTSTARSSSRLQGSTCCTCRTRAAVPRSSTSWPGACR